MPNEIDARSKEIIQTILAQLGGQNRLQIMIGANTFVRTDHALSFKVKATNPKKITLITVSLEPTDTYRVTFRAGKNYTLLETHDDVYAEDLIRVIESVTGLYLTI